MPRTACKPNVAVSLGENVQRGSASKEQQGIPKDGEDPENIMAGRGGYWKSAYFFSVCDFCELKTVSYCTPYASCIGKTSNHHKTHTCF